MNLLTSILRAAAAPFAKPAGRGLDQIILPSARDRWLTKSASIFTPEYIETTLRSAFAGNLVAQWELFDLMEDTWPRLQKNLNDLKDAVVSLEWSLQPWTYGDEEPTPEAEVRRDFVEGVIWQMRPDPAADEGAFEQTIKDILDAWGKGIAVLEIDWMRGIAKTKAAPQAILPKATRWIHPRYYGYAFNGAKLQLEWTQIQAARAESNAMGMASVTGDRQWVDFPDSKFLISIAKAKSGHPIGAALLRALAWWWCASNFSAGWLLNFAQIFGLPIRWATYDPQKEGLLDKICEMLENLGSGGWGAFPAGTQLELKEPSKSGTDNPQTAMLDRADRQCDLLILGQTLTSDVGDSGSRALGEVHERVGNDRRTAAARHAANVINYQLIPAILRLNFGDDQEAPYFVPAAEEQKDAKAMAERDQILSNMGVKFPLNWFYERHEIPPPGEGDETVGGQPPPQPQLPGADARPNPEAKPERTERMQAKDVSPELVRQAIADAAGARVRWLEPLNQEIDRIAAAVQNQELTDGELTQFLDSAARNLPDLFAKLNVQALADSLEDALGAAAVQGLRDQKGGRK